MRAPMVIVSIGGIFSSTFMTLYVVPVLYSLVESLREFIVRRQKVDKIEESDNIDLQTIPDNA